MRSRRSAALKRAAILLIVVPVAAGCVTHRSDFTKRFVKSGKPKIDLDAPGPPQDSLEMNIEKLRRLSERVRPRTRAESSESAERTDKRLADALASLAGQPSAERYRVVAEAYRRAGILDAAYEYFSRALHLDPRDAAAYDGLARIWRDWGFPHLGLGDAYRAAYYAPRSAAPFNTLGTILQAMGRGLPARGAYERALELDSEASYALYNLCRLPVSAEQRDAAASACQLALRLSPRLENRSGSVTGESDRSTRFRSPAERELFNARYDLGILYLTQHRFSEATSTFERASIPPVALPDAVVHRTNTTAVEGIR